MHEFTIGGAWFRWRSFDATSRTLAISGMGMGAIAGLLIGMVARPVNPRFGFDVTQHVTLLAVIGVATAALAAWLWYRFSLRQDEMFNRVQTWTLGMAGAWACVASATWGVFSAASLAAPMPSAAPAMMFAAATMIFWFVAVRRWAF